MHHLSYFLTPTRGGCYCNHSYLSSEETEVEGVLITSQFAQQVKWPGGKNPGSVPQGSALNHAGLSPVPTKPLAKVARARKEESGYGFRWPLWPAVGGSSTPPEPQFFLPPVGLAPLAISGSEIHCFSTWVVTHGYNGSQALSPMDYIEGFYQISNVGKRRQGKKTLPSHSRIQGQQ